MLDCGSSLTFHHLRVERGAQLCVCLKSKPIQKIGDSSLPTIVSVLAHVFTRISLVVPGMIMFCQLQTEVFWAQTWTPGWGWDGSGWVRQLGRWLVMSCIDCSFTWGVYAWSQFLKVQVVPSCSSNDWLISRSRATSDTVWMEIRRNHPPPKSTPKKSKNGRLRRENSVGLDGFRGSQ